MKRKISILIVICVPLSLFIILKKPFFIPLPFHTYDPVKPSDISIDRHLKREKNYIDCYGNVWLFDKRLNQIVILQAGNEFLRKNNYIEHEKKYKFVDEDGGSYYMYVTTHYCCLVCCAGDLKHFRQEYGYDMAFTSSRNNIVVFEGTSKESVVEISPDTLIVGISGNYEAYPIKKNVAEYFTYSSRNIFDYDTAIEFLEKGITNKEKRNTFLASITGWQKSHDCRAFDAPLYQTVKTQGINIPHIPQE